MKLFPLTLWHGTSAHLLPLIREHGLGGRNVMADWRVMDFLEWAFPQVGVAEYDFHDPDYLDLLPIRAAVDGGAAGMNFEYGSVYVAGGYDRAADYAQSAPELISFVRILLDVAGRREMPSISDGLERFPELHQFLRQEPRPIVLKLPPTPMALIRDERGGPLLMPEQILEVSADSPEWSQAGFRIAAVVPFEGIEVIDASAHQSSALF